MRPSTPASPAHRSATPCPAFPTQRKGKPPARLVAGVAAVAAGAALVVSPALAGAAQADPTRAGGPLMFGASATTQKDVRAHQAVLGRRLNGLRVYKAWDDTLFGRDQVWERDTGHTLFMSIRSQRRDGSIVPFQAVADAQPGSALYEDMVAQAQQIKAFGATVYIAYNHEPEAQGAWEMGNGPQFVQAYRKVESVWRAQGVTNVRYVYTGTAYGFARTDERSIADYYPGDDWVDDVAADGYNWGDCRHDGGTWRSLADVIEAQREWGLRHPTKGLMLWEFSSTEDPRQPGRKALWYAQAATLFAQPGYEQYEAVLTWDGRHFTGASSDCTFDYRSSLSATAAWVALAESPDMSATRLP